MTEIGGQRWILSRSMRIQTLSPYRLTTRPHNLVFSAGFLTMTVDDTNSYLVTGDADGVVKVWDITEYCVGTVVDNDVPPRKYQNECCYSNLE